MAQLNTFAEKFSFDATKSLGLSEQIPNLRISGIGSLSQITDSADNGASANILAEFNLLDFKVNQVPMKNMLRLYLNFNVNAELNTTDRDSLRLSDIYFPDRSSVGFGAGVSTDLWRYIAAWNSGTYSVDKVHRLDNNDKHDYFRMEPVIEYSYSRWNLRSQYILNLGDSLLPPDTVLSIDRIQTSQWNVGVRCWYTMSSGDNVFGFLLYPHVRWQTVTDATLPVYIDLFRSKSATDVTPQSLSFMGMTIGLQINKVQFTFTYNELAQQVLINDRDVSGGVFLIKVTVVSDFLQF